jgi:hypothetical protein
MFIACTVNMLIIKITHIYLHRKSSFRGIDPIQNMDRLPYMFGNLTVF